MMIPTCCKNVHSDLLFSAKQGDYRAIEGILRCPASVINVGDHKGRTALILASMHGHNLAVQVLLANPNVDTNIGLYKSGETAFSMASRKGHLEVIRQLANKENNEVINGWCYDNWTPQSIFCKSTTAKIPSIATTNGVTGTSSKSNLKIHGCDG